MKLIGFLLLAFASQMSLHAADARPNIIVIFSDDHGWADLGEQGSVKDIRTPHLDALARDGVRFARGYVTAPQCVPSRAGLLTGRYQQRFGVEANGMGPLPLDELTIAERLKPAGYVSCQVGKWHLEATPEGKQSKKKRADDAKGGQSYQPWNQGFDEYFTGPMNTFAASHDLLGHKLPNAPQQLTDKRFRCLWQTDAALSFIDRHQRDPFFLYLAYYTPHVPLESPEPWFSKTPADAPLERRQALAMIAAMDDGIGRIREKLRAAGIEKNTLLFFIGDNGAPLKQGAWNGSLNLPLTGEKGMLTDGGIRTPFVAAWPGTLPEGKVYEPPVISLDVAATAVALAGLPRDEKLDGVNLLPFLLGEKMGNPHDALFWRWRSQAAIRADHWKLILLGRDERYLFDLDSPEGETRNRIADFPDVAAKLDKQLMAWNAPLPPPGLPRDVVPQDQIFFDAHVKQTGVTATKRAPPPARKRTDNSVRKPNVVFILADDLGWADTTLYGHTKFYQTPNLERLAKRGMTFTRAYSASPLCSPTRSAILTGLSPARTGITTPNCHLPQVVLEATVAAHGPANQKAVMPQPVTRLKTEYRTLAESLKDAGYATGHFGKWHLGAEPYSPLQQGFDVDVPHHPGPGPAGSYVAPWKFQDFDHDPGVPDQHIEDRMAKEAVAFMEQHKDQSFLLNYWMFSVHAPFDAKKSLIEKHRARANPNDPQRSPTYAAMIESMDDAVGTLLDTLDRLGIADRTIIVFTSDNGGNMYNEIDGTTPTSNAPLRGGKATMFEGGTRVPCVVSIPGITPPGSRSNELIQSEDFYPTLLEALSLPLAAEQRVDGVSLLPALKAGSLARDAVFQYFPHAPGVPDWLPPAVSVHRGDWKLIRIFHGGEDTAHRHLLFNLRDDLGEKHNLADKEPALVAELGTCIDRFLADTRAVVPIPNPKFDPQQYHPEDEGRSKPKAQPKAKAAPTGTAKTDYSDPALQGWKMRSGTAGVKDGIVTVRGKGDPFLGVGAGISGPAKASFRVRSAAGGEGKIEWIPSGGKAESIPFKISAGDWQTINLEIPATGSLGIFRLYLPAQTQPVELDHVELTGTGKPRRWDF